MLDRVSVLLPTWTQPSITQTVLGKRGVINGIEEFRGIPYGRVPERWQHAILLDRLPEDVFDATHNGYVSALNMFFRLSTNMKY